MKESVDCLLIGYNEVNINSVEEQIRVLGKDSNAYHDLNFSFIQKDGNKFSFGDIYNLVQKKNNPHFGKEDELHMGNYFSLGIAYLGTFLHRRNLTFDYVNSVQWDKEKLVDILENKEILTIAITTTYYTYHYPIQDIVAFVRRYNKKAKIIVGGPFVSNKVHYNKKTSLSYFKIIGADIYVNSYQGESTLVNIIESLKNGGDLAKVPNIFYRQGAGFAETFPLTENNNLEENMVDWSLFKGDLPKLTNLRSSISCPFTCSFCGFPERAGKHYTVSVKALERELDSLRDTNIESIFFIDDTFNIPKERFKEVLRMLIKNRYPFKWNSYFRCQFADHETLELMAKAGCEGVSLGIESGNQEVLNNMNKRVSVDSYARGVSLLNEYGITTGATFVVGFPGETDETLKDTVNFIEEFKPSYSTLLLWFYDPITPIEREKDKYGLEGSQFDWKHETMDAKRATEYLDDIFLSLKNSTWVRTAPLEGQAVYALLQKGKTMNHVNHLIRSFNACVGEKIRDRGLRDGDVSAEAFQALEKAILC